MSAVDGSRLKIEKRGYSVNPWRITWDGSEIKHFSFPRKRDAAPFLERLREFGDLDLVREWDDDVKASYCDLVRATPGAKLWTAAVDAGRRLYRS